MSDRDIRKAAEVALDAWGMEAQFRQTMEECAELIVACNKLLRDPESMQRLDELAGEIADVELMCEQMRVIVGDRLVNKRLVEKLDRLNGRLDRAAK